MAVFGPTVHPPSNQTAPVGTVWPVSPGTYDVTAVGTWWSMTLAFANAVGNIPSYTAPIPIGATALTGNVLPTIQYSFPSGATAYTVTTTLTSTVSTSITGATTFTVTTS